MKLNQKLVPVYKLILALSLMLGLAACGQNGHPEAKNLRDQFNTQLAASCEHSGLIYTKTVFDLSEASPQPQDSIFTGEQLFDQEEGKRDYATCQIVKDLAYTFSYHYDQPSLREYFELAQNQDTMIAAIKPEFASSNELQSQKILMHSQKEHFRYVESSIVKKSWLYELQIKIAVSFDEAGRYLSHRLEINNAVPLTDSKFHSQILGKAEYP